MQDPPQPFLPSTIFRGLVPWLTAISLGWSASARADRREAGTWERHVHDSGIAGIEENPLKGMMPFSSGVGRSFPHSMEWFYVPLRELQEGDEAFDWEPIERQLAEIAGRGHHAVFRVYLDYPGKAIGTPQYLIDAGVLMRSYTEAGNHLSVSRSPDWNDPRLMHALETFIHHFGKKYDGDSRIGFLTAGLYGFWGEWHNHPHDPEWEMKAENRDRLLNAYQKAFTQTRVLLRNPAGTTNPDLKASFGYHDDSFAYETLGPGWGFLPKLKGNGLLEIWQQMPIGGEIRPELQPTIFDAWPNAPMKVGNRTSEDLSECIESTHASWMLNEDLFARVLTDRQKRNALRAHRRLGYEFHVAASSVLWDQEGRLRVKVKIRNDGVAPFYYRWAAEFAAYDPQTQVMKVLGEAADWDLPDVLPGGGDYQREFISCASEDLRGQRLLIRIKNPLPNGKFLRFANVRQDEDLEGWLTLQEMPE